MAKRKSTRKKSAASSRSRARTREPEQYELPGGFWRQILAVIMIVMAIVLVFLWFGQGGEVLNAAQQGMVKGIGAGTFVLPVALVFLGVKTLMAENNRVSPMVWIATFLMVIWISGLCGAVTMSQAEPSGGILGVQMNKLIGEKLGVFAGVLVYLVLIFVTALFILQMSPVTAFKKIGALFGHREREEVIEEAPADKGVVKINGGSEDEEEEEPKKRGLIGRRKVLRKADIKGMPKEKPAEKPEPAPVEKALTSVTDKNWKLPSTSLLEKKSSPADPGNVQQNATIIQSTLRDFGIDVEMNNANIGPRVTQYTLKPPAGVNLQKILARDKELALNLAVKKVRIEAPIPGKSLVGVEIPNVKAADVRLRALLESTEWKNSPDPLTFAVGKDISGRTVVANLAKMPHLLIAGTTGSGKSVMTNAMIVSLLYRNAPSDLKLIIVDPKQVEMVQYSDIPHLLTPIITDTAQAVSALKWAVNEMERRYTLLAEERVKNIVEYNKKVAAGKVATPEGEEPRGKMPYIVILIDEMSDIMMQAGKEMEPPIVRVAQKGRAAGLHLVLATQKPIVKVVTGLIKGNVPARIAFAVSSTTDSMVMLDKGGAEKLLGAGDMLMLTTEMQGTPKRIQGAWLSDEEEEKVANFLKEQGPPEYNKEVVSQSVSIGGAAAGGAIGDMGRRFDPSDPLVRKAVEISLQKGKFSTAMLQTYLGKGHGFVSGLAIWFEEIGVIGPANGNKPRDVLVKSMEEFDQLAGV